MAGMNSAVAAAASRDGPAKHEDYVEYWKGHLHGLRKSKIGVPDDDLIRQSIRIRQAFVGGFLEKLSLSCVLFWKPQIQAKFT